MLAARQDVGSFLSVGVALASGAGTQPRGLRDCAEGARLREQVTVDAAGAGQRNCEGSLPSA